MRYAQPSRFLNVQILTHFMHRTHSDSSITGYKKP